MVFIDEVVGPELDKEIADELCEIMTPAFNEANVGNKCFGVEFKNFWESMFRSPSPAVLFVLRDDSRIVGLLGGVTFNDPLTHLWYAAEVVWMVIPEFRSQGWGIKLLQSFEWWARSHGCSRVVINFSTGREDSLSKKIIPLGYNPHRIEFLKEL